MNTKYMIRLILMKLRLKQSQSRLDPYGVGPLASVSSNETEESRALNRRVELVKE